MFKNITLRPGSILRFQDAVISTLEGETTPSGACFLPCIHPAGCLGGSGGGSLAVSCQPAESYENRRSTNLLASLESVQNIYTPVKNGLNSNCCC